MPISTSQKTISKISSEKLDVFIKEATDKLEKKIEELERTKLGLEQRIQERTAEIEKRAKELEDSRKALVNMLEDIDEERKKSEEEKNKTRAIIDNFSDGLLVLDQENKLLMINPRAEKFLEVNAEKIVGNLISDLVNLSYFKSLDDLIRSRGDFKAKDETETKEVFRKELAIKESLVLEVSTLPMFFNKESAGTLVVLHDITREKMVERMKTEFVSVAAHQLRTPLSAIKWTLKMFLDGDLGDLSKNQKEFIEKTYISNERMISLINDLLDITRIEEGRYVYKPVPSSIENIVSFITESSREEAIRRGIALEFQKPKVKLPKATIDVEKIKLVIQNFFDNAAKYTPKGGKITVSLEYDKNKQEIVFSIRDTGVGIPKDQHSRVFTKFFRGANVIKMETDGSGLGLFISKNIIEAHGGRIWFESEEGKGTVFHVSIPSKEEFGEFLKEF